MNQDALPQLDAHVEKIDGSVDVSLLELLYRYVLYLLSHVQPFEWEVHDSLTGKDIWHFSSCAVYDSCDFIQNDEFYVLSVDSGTLAAYTSPIKKPSLILMAPISMDMWKKNNRYNQFVMRCSSVGDILLMMHLTRWIGVHDMATMTRTFHRKSLSILDVSM